jgi:hypothetical protein
MQPRQHRIAAGVLSSSARLFQAIAASDKPQLSRHAQRPTKLVPRRTTASKTPGAANRALAVRPPAKEEPATKTGPYDATAVPQPALASWTSRSRGACNRPRCIHGKHSTGSGVDVTDPVATMKCSPHCEGAGIRRRIAASEEVRMIPNLCGP